MTATTPHPRLSGRTVVVVGASTGIGRAVALRAGQAGAAVVVFSRRADALAELAGLIRDRGGRAHAVSGDVASTTDLERLAAEAERVFGRIDVWVSNAGVATIGPFWDAPLDEHERVVDTNLSGVMRAAHIALRRFVAQGHGMLVHTASVESVVPLAYQASYTATKAGVLALTRALRQELRLAGPAGVSVTAVLPWAVRTPFWRHAGNHSGRALRLPLMDEPEKIADAILRAAVAPREQIASASRRARLSSRTVSLRASRPARQPTWCGSASTGARRPRRAREPSTPPSTIPRRPPRRRVGIAEGGASGPAPPRSSQCRRSARLAMPMTAHPARIHGPATMRGSIQV